ncbi:phage minor head protein [Pseudomonas qingdaonensis]|nr:phage minor head protein [Pseudomonas qingdaonensis]
MVGEPGPSSKPTCGSPTRAGGGADGRSRAAQGSPYGLYRHGDALTRPQHLAWDGTVLPLDDPWWSTHTPQNGWGCKCKFMVSERDVEAAGPEGWPAPAVSTKTGPSG